MPRVSQQLSRDDQEQLVHPEGVAGQPEATHPHEADPQPNTEKPKRQRVNPGLVPSTFSVIGDELPEGVEPSNRGGRGRPIGNDTVAALRFIRSHPNQWLEIAEYVTKSAPPARLGWLGYLVNEDGELIEPDERQEQATRPEDYPVKKRIDYRFRIDPTNGHYKLLVKTTDQDWIPPKKRAPKSESVEESMEPTEA